MSSSRGALRSPLLEVQKSTDVCTQNGEKKIRKEEWWGECVEMNLKSKKESKKCRSKQEKESNVNVKRKRR